MKQKNDWNFKEMAVLDFRYREGEKMKDLANFYGVSSSRIRQVLDKYLRFLRWETTKVLGKQENE